MVQHFKLSFNNKKMDTDQKKPLKTDLLEKNNEHFSYKFKINTQRSHTPYFFEQIKNLWYYRELAIELFWTYLKLRYVGSFLGFLWTMLNPILYIATYWIVFSQIIRMGLQNYPLFLIPGFLAWNFTFGSLISASESILNSHHLITKISFPIEILTFTSVAVALFDFLISMIIYLIVFLIIPPKLPLTTLGLPFVILVQVLFTTGLALLVACSSVFFRDIPKLIPILGTIMFFLTPIFYPLSYVPDAIKIIIKLNPMTQIVTLYHELLYYNVWPDLRTFGLTFFIAVLFFMIGYWVFNHNRHIITELS